MSDRRNDTKIAVLFVCMGNICRSPTAEGVFAHLVQKRDLGYLIEVDSAGTIAHHQGEPPDARAQATARGQGIDISRQRARQVHRDDFERFDYLVAMDTENLLDLKKRCPTPYADRLHLLCDFTREHKGRSVPDPYYGGANGFDRVFRLIEDASKGLLRVIEEKNLKRDGRKH